MSVRIGVYATDATTFIANVPRASNVRWLDEVNAPGTGQFDVHLDDPTLSVYPTLLDDYNVVKTYVSGLLVKSWRIENKNPTRVSQSEAAGRVVTVSGRGPAADLEAAVVYPEYGLRELTAEDRYFNFASAEGAWYNPTDWDVPVGVAWSADTTGREGYPKNWPDPLAKWLWVSDPNADSAPGNNWFRATITLTETTPVIIYTTGDNQFVAYMDGVKILSSGAATNAFRTLSPRRMTLAAGDHVFAALVTNLGNGASGTNDNPGGWIASIYRTDALGNPTADNVWRSSTTNTLVKGYGEQPGWSGAAILEQLVLEAQDRNVDVLMPVTFDFDGATDSGGDPWTDIQDRIVKVGTTDLADLATQVIELSLDMEIDANFVMHCWNKRGVDRSGTVRILPNKDALSVAGTTQAGRVRNQALLKFDGGWMELFSAVSKDTYGRREVGLSAGTSGSTTQVALIGTAALREVVSPERTIPLSITSVAGPQPYVDFFLGDTITIPDDYSSMITGRLMSIAGSVIGEGSAVQWDLDFYPETNDDDIDTVVIAVGGSFSDTSTLYQEEVLSDSPWGYWRLKETAGTTFADLSGHKYTATMAWPGTGTTHKPTLAVAGPVESAAEFDANTGGTTDTIYPMAHAQTFVTSDSKLFSYKYATLEIWVKRLTTPGGRAALLEAWALSTDTQWQLGINSSGHAYFLYDDTDGVTHVLNSTSVLSSTGFTHVVGSLGTKGHKLYVNGVLDQHVTSGLGTAKHVGYNFALRGDASGDACSVQIAEPAVYFQQLTDSRIKSHFSASAYTP